MVNARLQFCAISKAREPWTTLFVWRDATGTLTKYGHVDCVVKMNLKWHTCSRFRCTTPRSGMVWIGTRFWVGAWAWARARTRARTRARARTRTRAGAWAGPGARAGAGVGARVVRHQCKVRIGVVLHPSMQSKSYALI